MANRQKKKKKNKHKHVEDVFKIVDEEKRRAFYKKKIRQAFKIFVDGENISKDDLYIHAGWVFLSHYSNHILGIWDS